MERIIKIEAGTVDQSRPSERPPKSNWRIEMVKKGLSMLQHITTTKTAEVIWHYFTQPGKVKFSGAQEEVIGRAELFTSKYNGSVIQHYRWGTTGPKVLLCHGWRSKASDFRRMIEALVAAGYVVEAMDMKAHGKSEGTQSALPEFRDVLKEHYVQHGPYEALLGYSLGGLAAGLVASELATYFQPHKLILIAAPPYARYFFRDIINDLGFKTEVYQSFCELVERNYNQPVDYFDLRSKVSKIENIETHFIYDEDDQTVPFEKGQELIDIFPKARFVHSMGLGHYKIISSKLIIDHVLKIMDSKSCENQKLDKTEATN
ncbi:MAG: alpha/beta hydrolase [Cyclobacteriaceae bacterium]